MRILRFLLFPMAILYDLITSIRNYLFDIGHKKSFEFTVPVISVGNLNTGGSGKTPMIEYLIRLLTDTQRVATLSRGYGRKTSGIRFAGADDSALTIGDEPFQLYSKFNHNVHVVVGEDRAFAIPNILHEYPDTSVILLDDGFQHRSVKPHCSILVTEYSKPFFNDFVLPVGNLREARRGASRANVVVMTKCPTDISALQIQSLTLRIQKYVKSPVFFSGIKYGTLKQFSGRVSNVFEDVVLVSGIANASTFETRCRLQYHVVKHFQFADHHRYTVREIKTICEFISGQQKNTALVTTEKDWVRLSTAGFMILLKDISCYYLPIEMSFIENGSEFDKQILAAIPERHTDYL
jgi:tetraacyldisaccharide 4'-kinase